MPHENQNSPGKVPGLAPGKEKKYIQLQGFVKVDKDKTIHFPTGSGSSFTTSAVSQELFQTTVNGETAWFANVLIPYSEANLKALQASGSGGEHGEPTPGVIVVPPPPPVKGPKSIPTGDFSWKVVQWTGLK